MVRARSPQLYSLLSQGRLLRFKKNQVVASTSDKNIIMLVVSGYIKRYLISNDGSLGTQIVYGPQDLFSFTKIFDVLLGQSIYDGPEVYYYETMSDVRAYSIDADTFAGAVKDNPLLYKDLFSETGHHLKACVHNIENISLPNAYARVAHELLFFAKKFGKQTSEGVKIDPPLTHQDIAHSLGITRETVTKALITLRKQGLVSEDRSFVIPDLERLEQAAYQS